MQKIIDVIRIRKPISYSDGLELQRSHGSRLEHSGDARSCLILLEHKPVFTLGRTTAPQHLICTEKELAQRTGADVLQTDRGGSVTYHAPGQLTAYLLLHLRRWQIEIHQHLFMLEECAIKTLDRFCIQGRHLEGMTGAWVDTGQDEKICAIGVSARRWITYHGLSLNVNIELTPFMEVVPCGLAGKGVTSMARVLNREIGIDEVASVLIGAFGEVYGARIEYASS